MSKFSQVAAACLAVVLGMSAARAADVKLADGTVLGDKPFYIITYIEVDPAATDKAKALIVKHSADSRKDAGVVSSQALQRSERKNHFILMQTWSDPAARDAHAKAAHTVDFRKALAPMLYSPFDERAHVAMVAADAMKLPKVGKGAVVAITHVDIIPTEQIAPCNRQYAGGPCGLDLVRQLVASGRKDAGNLRFDALTQANRPNHVKVVEVWASAAAQQKHAMSKGSRDFRDQLAGIAPGTGLAKDPTVLLNPLSGSLYDERLFVAID